MMQGPAANLQFTLQAIDKAVRNGNMTIAQAEEQKKKLLQQFGGAAVLPGGGLTADQKMAFELAAVDKAVEAGLCEPARALEQKAEISRKYLAPAPAPAALEPVPVAAPKDDGGWQAAAEQKARMNVLPASVDGFRPRGGPLPAQVPTQRHPLNAGTVTEQPNPQIRHALPMKVEAGPVAGVVLSEAAQLLIAYVLEREGVSPHVAEIAASGVGTLVGDVMQLLTPAPDPETSPAIVEHAP